MLIDNFESKGTSYRFIHHPIIYKRTNNHIPLKKDIFIKYPNEHKPDINNTIAIASFFLLTSFNQEFKNGETQYNVKYAGINHKPWDSDTGLNIDNAKSFIVTT